MSFALQAQATDAVQSVAEARLHLFGDYFLAIPGSRDRSLGDPGDRARPRAFFPRQRPHRRFARGVAAAIVHPKTVLRSDRARSGAFLLVAIAMARPVRANELRTNTSEGIDIVLAIDRSGSMQYRTSIPRRRALKSSRTSSATS